MGPFRMASDGRPVRGTGRVGGRAANPRRRARFAERQEGRRKAGQKAGKAWEAYHRLQRQRAAREWAPRDLRVKAQPGAVAAE